MLTSSTSKQETNNIYSKLKDMASGKSDASDIKLCYVTVRSTMTDIIGHSAKLDAARESCAKQDV